MQQRIEDLDDLFLESKGKPIKYNGKILLAVDRLAVEKGDVFEVVLEKFNSEWEQGITLNLKGSIIMNNRESTQGSIIWQHTAPKKISFEVQPKKKKDLLSLYNVWDRTNYGRADAWVGGAAMIREDIPNGARYYCNDGHYDENFDDLVFSIVKTKGTWEAQPLEAIEDEPSP